MIKVDFTAHERLLQLQLCVSTSSWSDGFSLDTVGSYGCVRCPANHMDFLVTFSFFSNFAHERVNPGVSRRAS